MSHYPRDAIDNMSDPSHQGAALDDLPTLGLLTGISYVSGLDYYRHINENFDAAAQARGFIGLVMAPNPQMVLVSVNCDRYASSLIAADWDTVHAYLLQAVARLVAAGAEVLCIASNTGHIAAERIAAAHPSLPLLHIADCIARHARARGWRRLGLLGTAITMQQPFLQARLARHGLDITVPAAAVDQERLFRIIMEDLSRGRFPREARVFIARVVRDLAARGVEAVILGCTELELLVEGTEGDSGTGADQSQDAEGDIANERDGGERADRRQTSSDGIDMVLPLLPSGRLHMDAAVRVAAGLDTVADYLPHTQQDR